MRLIATISALLLLAALAACGSDGGGGCPGVTCTNCAGGEDCDQELGSCGSGHVQVCVTHPDSSSLRCAYCK